MVVVILLLLLLCLSSSSMLYGLGFIPGTGNYARGSLKLNKLSLKNLDESCAIIKKVAAENPDPENPNYFTFGGMKSFSDLLSSDEGDKVEYIYEVCEGMHRGTILTFGEFKAAVREHHTWTCKEIEDAVQGRTAIIYDGKLISLTDAYKKIYPDLIERCSVNTPISEASPAAPSASTYIYDEKHFVTGSPTYSELGSGNSLSACRALAVTAGVPAFGHRTALNTCWGINDVSTGTIDTLANHRVTCTDSKYDLATNKCGP